MDIGITVFSGAYGLAPPALGRAVEERGFESLDRAFRERDVWLVWLKTEPRFDCLRSDARYQEILKRVGFPE